MPLKQNLHVASMSIVDVQDTLLVPNNLPIVEMGPCLSNIRGIISLVLGKALVLLTRFSTKTGLL